MGLKTAPLCLQPLYASDEWSPPHHAEEATANPPHVGMSDQVHATEPPAGGSLDSGPDKDVLWQPWGSRAALSWQRVADTHIGTVLTGTSLQSLTQKTDGIDFKINMWVTKKHLEKSGDYGRKTLEVQGGNGKKIDIDNRRDAVQNIW